MQLKTVLSSGVIAAIALIVAAPLVAQAIPQRSRNACIRSTAEEMGASTSNIRITDVGPVSAESGAVTVSLEDRTNGQTANCRVNTVDNTVLSVTLTGSGDNTAGSGNSSGQNPEFWVASTKTRFREKPGIFSKVVKGNVPKGTVLRNLGCQSTQTPTWCQVAYRDNPQSQGWVFSTDIQAYQASTTNPTNPSTNPPSSISPGTPVSSLSDLVGARAGQAEATLENRGYEFVKTITAPPDKYSFWRESGSNSCISVRTSQGRYDSIVYTNDADCNR